MKAKILVVLTVLAGLMLLGCGWAADRPDDDEKYMTGQVTDRSDRKAPKEILSKNITSLSTHFNLFNLDTERLEAYYIKIDPAEEGGYLLHVDGFYQYETKVDEKVLSEVQAIIDRCALVRRNGTDRVTAGLPPDFEPWMMYVTYDSGEKLYFRENGAPEADWTEDLCELLDIRAHQRDS